MGQKEKGLDLDRGLFKKLQGVIKKLSLYYLFKSRLFPF